MVDRGQTSGAGRLIVCVPTGDGDPGVLARSDFVDQRWIHGGVRSMHELAFAATAAGHEVELRGWLDRPLFEQLAAASGVTPGLADKTRQAVADDIVVVANSFADPLTYGLPWLSEARLVLLTLAPLGLLGWPFVPGWSPPSALGATPEHVNRSGHFDALTAMGIVLWTNAQAVAELAAARGLHSAMLGCGQPIPFPDAPSKSVDVAWLTDNRWASRSRAIVAKLSCRTCAVPTAGHDEMLEHLGQARILLHPGGVEGEPRITREARAMGTVPVALDGNPVARHLTDADGVVAVEHLETIPATVSALLADPDRLSSLAARAMATARSEVAWDPYVARVNAAIDAVPEPDAATGARATIGARFRGNAAELIAAVDKARARVAELDAELHRRWKHSQELQAELHRRRTRNAELDAELHRRHTRDIELEAELHRRQTRNEELETELYRVRARKDEVERERLMLLNRSSVRWSVGAADLVRGLTRRQRGGDQVG
jgi:hypothetical protein